MVAKLRSKVMRDPGGWLCPSSFHASPAPPRQRFRVTALDTLVYVLGHAPRASPDSVQLGKRGLLSVDECLCWIT